MLSRPLAAMGLSAVFCGLVSMCVTVTVAQESVWASRVRFVPRDTLELPLSESNSVSIAGPGNEGVYRLNEATLRRFATLEEALEAIPGFRVRRQGGLGGYSELSFRGARASQIDIYVDGIRLNQDGDAAPDLAKWPMLWFSSLEARTGFDPQGAGPGSLARIDLSTRNESRAEFKARIGSFHTAEMAASTQAEIPGMGGWVLSAGLEGQTARNDYPFFSDNGTRYNTADDATLRMKNNAYWSRGLRTAARRETAASRQSASLVWLDNRKEYPGLFPSNAQAYGRRSDWLGAWRLEHFGGPLPWETGFQARRFEDSYHDPAQSLGYLSYEAARLSLSAEGDARVRARIASRLGVHADARLRAEETKPLVTPYSAQYSSPDATRGEAQVGLGADARLAKRVTGTVEARQSFIRFRAEGMGVFPNNTLGVIASAKYRPTALRAGIQWATAGHTVGLSGRREERAPTSGELLGDNLGVLSKLDLRPEEARSLALSYTLAPQGSQDDVSFIRPSLQSTVFWNNYLDPIRLKAHGASAFMRYDNDADYRSLGFESLASLAAGFIETSLSVTWQEARIIKGLYEGNHPAYQSPLEAHAEFFVKPFDNWLMNPRLQSRVGILADFRSAYYPDDVNIADSRRDAEWELGAHAGLSRGPLQLAADARNLTDRHYRDFAYSPRSGRSYSVSFSFNF